MSDNTITITIHGIPQPQGSKTAVNNPRTGRAMVIDAGTSQSRKRHKSWRQAVAEAARRHIDEHPDFVPLDEPVRLKAEFFFPLPAGDKYRTFHAVKPDYDKLLRAISDSLKDSGLLGDDARICSGSWDKLYCSDDEVPGARLVLTPLGRIEAERRQIKKDLAKAGRRAATG